MVDYAIEIGAHDGAAVTTLRYATATINTAATDSPAHTTYRGLIKDAGSIKRSVSLLGRVSESRGGAILNNGNGGLDVLFGYGWGRSFVLRELASRQDLVSTSPVVATGIVLGVDGGSPFAEIRLRLRDQLVAIATPLLTQRYLGTTTDGSMTTVEGDEDVAGKLKQRVFGSRKSVPVVWVNRFHLIGQVSDGPVASMVVKDGGVALENAGNFGDVDALLAAIFPDDEDHQYFATCNALGLFRLDDSPVFTVVADVVEGATVADRSAARIVGRMFDLMIDEGADISYDQASLDALHALNPAEVGLFVDADTNADVLISDVLNWIGAALDPGADGVVRFFSITAPVGIPIATFDLRDISGGTFAFMVNPDDEGGSSPAWSAVLNYGGVQQVLNASELAGSVPLEERTFLGQAKQTVPPTQDLSVLTVHPQAVEITIDTGFRFVADATTEAQRRLVMHKVRRDRIAITVPDSIGRIALGEVVSVAFERFGYAGGKLMRVLGRTDDFSKRNVELELWG